MKKNKPQLALQVPILATARIERSILLIRGLKVMLDMDLAELYGVTTKNSRNRAA